MAEADDNKKEKLRSADTPMMRQFYRIKQKYPDAILLFRVGDFYETFAEDAVEASRLLGLTLTKRSNGGAAGVDLAGFPHHAVDTYLPRLVRAGKRVAICDQLEDPKLTTKLVKRGITELVTPGTAVEESVLENKENSYLAAIIENEKQKLYGVSFMDVSTGLYLAAEGNIDYMRKLFAAYRPKEVIVSFALHDRFTALFNYETFLYKADDWYFNESNNRDRLLRHFKVLSLKGFGLEEYPLAATAAGAVLNYLDVTRHGSLGHINSLRRIDESDRMRLDGFTVYSLELLESMHPGGKSLLSVLDETVTPMGGRLLREWVRFPLKSVAPIQWRQKIVDFFFRNTASLETFTNSRSGATLVGDLERTVARIAMRRTNPRQVEALCNALEALAPLKEQLIASGCAELTEVAQRIDPLPDLSARIRYQLAPDPPVTPSKERHTIADGFNEELDDLRRLSEHGKEYLLEMQQRESERTGIASLKIGFNNVFGYYLEVRNTYKSKVPPEWIRKQTLVSSERYITEELKEYEDKIVGAEQRILELETRFFSELVEAIQPYIQSLQQTCSALAVIDVLAAFAVVASEYDYRMPTVDDSYRIDIVEGRHPVIERQLPPHEAYIPNTVHLDNDGCQIMLVTGPNMSGKSALLRQTALITLMAQIGSFVPADAASIGMVDAIFTRVGASDNISSGESTFMVEMQEAANIINNLTPRSLVLFDELGRGTSTFDGISIAWAIVEYLHNRAGLKPKTLFATHYHELNELADALPNVYNFNVSAKEVDGEMIFLRKLVAGSNEHSFGIEVAKLAGLPAPVVARAKDILRSLESERVGGNLDVKLPKGAKRSNKQPKTRREDGFSLSLFDISDPQLLALRDELQATDINSMTPLEALNTLSRLKAILNKY